MGDHISVSSRRYHETWIPNFSLKLLFSLPGKVLQQAKHRLTRPKTGGGPLDGRRWWSDPRNFDVLPLCRAIMVVVDRKPTDAIWYTSLNTLFLPGQMAFVEVLLIRAGNESVSLHLSTSAVSKTIVAIWAHYVYREDGLHRGSWSVSSQTRYCREVHRRSTKERKKRSWCSTLFP